MSDKTKLQEIKQKVTNPNISLSEVENFQNKLNKIAETLMEEKDKKEERNLVREASEVMIDAIVNHIDKWIKGEIKPSETEAVFLRNQFLGHKEIEKNWALFEEFINKNEIFDEDEKQKSIKLLKGSIEKFKKRQANLMILFQQWQEEHQSESPQEENEDSGSNETSAENQQNETSSTRGGSSSDTSKGSGKGKGLPAWGWILIILGVLVVAGAAAYFILERKEKPKPKKVKKVDKQNG